MNSKVHDVAAYILEKFRFEISTMKLQKLLFLSKGWSFPILNYPLFEDNFQAYENGPVCWRIFNLHRGKWAVYTWPWGDSNNLTLDEKRLVDFVVNEYGSYSGDQLSEITHEPGTPWSLVWNNDNLDDIIPDDSIKDYYVKEYQSLTS